jgi:hypothetical protein
MIVENKHPYQSRSSRKSIFISKHKFPPFLLVIQSFSADYVVKIDVACKKNVLHPNSQYSNLDCRSNKITPLLNKRYCKWCMPIKQMAHRNKVVCRGTNEGAFHRCSNKWTQITAKPIVILNLNEMSFYVHQSSWIVHLNFCFIILRVNNNCKTLEEKRKLTPIISLSPLRFWGIRSFLYDTVNF